MGYKTDRDISYYLPLFNTEFSHPTGDQKFLSLCRELSKLLSLVAFVSYY